MRKFVVCIEWDYSRFPKIFEECIIYPVTKAFPMEYDGYNVVGGCGRDGIRIDVYDNLEIAIQNCGFKLEHIKFKYLSVTECLLKNKIIKKIKNVKV